MDLVELSPFLKKLSEAKICKFIGLVFDEYVSWLQISVDNGVLMQISVATDELFDDDKRLSLRHFLALLEHVFKRPFVAEFLEQIDVVRGLFDVEEFDDVGVLDSLHDFDLVLERLVKFLRILLDVGS